MIEQIKEKLNAVWEKRRSVFPCHTNRASQIGADCLRQLVYYRTSWDKQELPSIDLIKVFDEGRLQEEAVKRLLMDAGFEIIEAQRSVADDLLKKYHISGHLDFYLGGANGGKPILTEVKSMSLNIFRSMETIDDFRRYSWTRKYKAQMMVYLLGAGETHGMFILKNKSTGELKFIMVELDLEYAESILARAQQIEAHLVAGTMPDKIDDAKECGYCPFKHLCLPDVINQAAHLINDPHFEAMLERREALDPLRKEYAKLDAEIKETVKVVPEVQIIVGDWLIEKIPIARGVRVDIRRFSKPNVEEVT